MSICRAVAVAAMAGVGVAGAESAATWDFEGPDHGWRPRADTVRLELAPGTRPGGTGVFCLRVAGSIASGLNYAMSPPRAMAAGGAYRLSAWVRVVRLSAGAPMPALKCEFVGASPATAPSRVTTGAYDPRRLDAWQELSVEFRAPVDTASCWLALEKGGQGPMQIVACLDDVRIEPISIEALHHRFALAPGPAAALAACTERPRLFLDAARLAALRQARDGSHAGLWADLRSQADRLAAKPPPPYIENDGYSGAEQLWQREVGNAMPHLAMAWLLSGERRYLEAAQAYALASCSYRTWGLGRTDGMDLAAGHQLLGLAVVYDWCHADLEAPARATLQAQLESRGRAMFESAAAGTAWWGRSYLQNHLWVNACGLAAAGFALHGEVADAKYWVGWAQQAFVTTQEALGDDGASHEGAGYWQYGVEYLLKYMQLSHDLLGVDLDLQARPWWRQTAAYGLYLTIPRAAWRSGYALVDLADCPRGNWYGPDHLLRRLAAVWRDPQAQWLAGQIDEANVDAPSARWLNLVWYDPELVAEPPTALPTLRHFADLGIVSARSDWSGRESLVVFKSGPPLGHKATREFGHDPGSGHVHPDANHLVLFGGGEWLLRDDGYAAKWTGQHNTLLVGGRGQLGEGHEWFAWAPPASGSGVARVVGASSSPALDHIVGEAAPAYPPELGLRRFARHLLFVKPAALIVIDDIEMAGAADLELRFHPESKTVAQEGWCVRVSGRQTHLRQDVLTPANATLTVEAVAAAGRQGKGAELTTIRLRTRQAAWRNAVAFSWGPTAAALTGVSLRVEGPRWHFDGLPVAVCFDWSTGKASSGALRE